MAEAYGRRPSDFFEFETDLAAWALDEACLLTGRMVEKELQEGKEPFGKTKTEGKKYASAKKVGKIKKMDLGKLGIVRK